MKLKHLHAQLEAVEGFRTPKVMLEQYPTGPEIASNCVYIMHQSFDAVAGKAIGDLGCGCGMLSIATALMGAAFVVGYELDTEAAGVMQANIKEMELGRKIEIVMCDVTSLLLKQPIKVYPLSSISVPLPTTSSSSSASSSCAPSSVEEKVKKLSLEEEEDASQESDEEIKLSKGSNRGKKGVRGKGRGRGRQKAAVPREKLKLTQVEETEPDEDAVDWLGRWALPPVKLFDTVITNPPFGTREKGIDMIFVQVGLQLARDSVFSFHKTSTREHILKKAAQWGANAQVLTSIRFDIPHMYSFHSKASKDIEVDFIRFSHRRPM